MVNDQPKQHPFSLVGKRVWVAGDGGMVGSALLRRLQLEGCDILAVRRAEVDLRRQDEVERWMARARPEVVFVAAATVGGIMANETRPAEFIYDNIMIGANVINAAHQTDVRKLMYLGSSCIYPRLAPQPITEDALLTGPLEPTNEWYAMAKITGIKLCQAYRRQYKRDFISVMPTNLYGPGDNYDLFGSHVIPAMLRKAHVAKTTNAPELVIWGTGTPRREFLHVDDCADGLVMLMQDYSAHDHINLGSGEDMTIAELATTVADVVGYRGEIVYDRSKPDGMPRKLMSAARMRALGWRPRIGLREGLADAYRWFVDHVELVH
jgi:GDP-L-fucose synthase